MEPEFLEKISISGYKSIKNATVELNRVNVLIGSNGAGKSNFISTFVLIQEIFNQNLQLYVSKIGLKSFFYNGMKETENFCIKLENNNYHYECDVQFTSDNRLIFKNELYADKIMGQNFPDQAVGHFGKINKGHFETIYSSDNKNFAENDGVYLGDICFRVYHFHDTSRSSPMKQEQSLANDQFLMEDARNIATFLYRLKKEYQKEYQRILRTIRLIAPYFDDFHLEPHGEYKEHTQLRWKQKGCEDVFYPSQLSDGTLRFACLATLLLQPAEMKPATVIIDEPELGLHPFAITILAELVRKSGSQVILSTQSVELLNQFNVEDVIVADRGENGTELRRLDPEALEMWLEDYSLGELWQKNVLGGRLTPRKMCISCVKGRR